ncbi:MAG TPA: hypothetical protein VJM79_00420 [Rhizorhapis sp.]|nr:hypothetical protein [Rhizorhapis sp.]
MAALTRAEMLTIYQDARHIHAQSRLPDVRRKAKAIAAAMERCIGVQGGVSVDCWRD